MTPEYTMVARLGILPILFIIGQVDEAGRQERLTCHRGSKTPRRIGRLTTINILEQRNDNEYGLPFVRSSQLGGLSNIQNHDDEPGRRKLEPKLLTVRAVVDERAQTQGGARK